MVSERMTLPACLRPVPVELCPVEARMLRPGDVIVIEGAALEIAGATDFGLFVRLAWQDGVLAYSDVRPSRTFHRAGHLAGLRLC